MTAETETELLAIAETLEDAANDFDWKHRDSLERLISCANAVNESWSGSNLGYHANVYYSGLRPRPPGAHFSIEWGLRDMSYTSMGTVGDWDEYAPSFVKGIIFDRAGNPDLTQAKLLCSVTSTIVNRCRSELISIFTIQLERMPDKLIENWSRAVEKVSYPSMYELCRGFLPSGRLMSRDSNAVMAGLKVAPHQEIVAEAAALNAVVSAARETAEIARTSAAHIARKRNAMVEKGHKGKKVFIGHGRSSLWRELKDFVEGRLKVPHEEFNRVPVAGITNIARLSDMLDNACFALLVLTAEDEQKSGAIHARMNVIHEAGLFQGRLGFAKAIILLEEGCEEFSNVQGLGQIRFPKGNIGACFQSVREVFEREGILP